MRRCNIFTLFRLICIFLSLSLSATISFHLNTSPLSYVVHLEDFFFSLKKNMYYDAIAFEIENVTGWHLMQVLAADIMEMTETSVIIENTTKFPNEENKEMTDQTSIVVSTKATTQEPGTSSAEISRESNDLRRVFTDFVTTPQGIVIQSTAMPSKELETSSIEVSAASEKYETPPTTVPATTHAVPVKPVDKKTIPTVVHTESVDAGAQEGDRCSNGSHDCSPNGKCIPMEGSYDCACNQGFEGNGRLCTDIDECENGFNDCHVNASCVNVPGSYYCHCREGLVGSGKHCKEAQGTKAPTPFEVETEGPSDVGAQGIDDCSAGSHNCSSNGTCIPREGSYDCFCNLGFEGDGISCADINECNNGDNDCHLNASCYNVPGGYYCQCNQGFAGNGTFCEDLDECAGEKPVCDINARCLNAMGAFSCACKEGYVGDGKACRGIQTQCHGSMMKHGHTCKHKLKNFAWSNVCPFCNPKARHVELYK